MAVRILSSDLVNVELEALIKRGDPDKKRFTHASEIDQSGTGVSGLAGALQITGIPVPGIMVLDICWRTGNEEVLMKDEVPSQNINIQFQVQGDVQARFQGLKHTLDMAPGRHNLIFAPEPGDETRVRRNTELKMLHLSIEREHFAKLIGTDSLWCERILRDLEAGRPFSAIEGTGTISPAMMQLVQGILNPASLEMGPLRRLQLHARMLDLLSLQFGQFVNAESSQSTNKPLSSDDAERLHQLKTYLDGHFLEEHSLARLGQSFLMNEFKLKYGFRRMFGTSIFGYLKELRMAYAASQLRDARQSVEEVAFTLGYEHAHHFSAAFKRHFGNSPVQWLQKGKLTI